MKIEPGELIKEEPMEEVMVIEVDGGESLQVQVFEEATTVRCNTTGETMEGGLTLETGFSSMPDKGRAAAPPGLSTKQEPAEAHDSQASTEHTQNEIQSALLGAHPEAFCRILRTVGTFGARTMYFAELPRSQLPCQVARPGEVVRLDHIKFEDRDHRREMIQLVTRLRDNWHRNIVRVYENYIPSNGDLWVMSEAPQGICARHLKTSIGIAEEATARICKGVCLALQHLHANLIVYRELRAATVGVTSRGKPVLLSSAAGMPLRVDFGRGIAIVGEPPWMAPEMLSYKGYSTKADIWSLGIMVMEMTAPEHPFLHPRSMYETIRFIQERGPPKLEPSQGSEELRDFMSRCLCVNQKERASVEEVLEHDFLKKACSTETMALMICEQMNIRGMERMTLDET